MGCFLISLGFKVSDKQSLMFVVLAWLVADALDSTFEFSGKPTKNGEVPWKNKAPFEHPCNEFKDDEVKDPTFERRRNTNIGGERPR